MKPVPALSKPVIARVGRRLVVKYMPGKTGKLAISVKRNGKTIATCKVGVVRARSATCRFTLKKSKVKKLNGQDHGLRQAHGQGQDRGHPQARPCRSRSRPAALESDPSASSLRSGSEDAAGPRLRRGPACRIEAALRGRFVVVAQLLGHGRVWSGDADAHGDRLDGGAAALLPATAEAACVPTTTAPSRTARSPVWRATSRASISTCRRPAAAGARRCRWWCGCTAAGTARATRPSRWPPRSPCSPSAGGSSPASTTG